MASYLFVDINTLLSRLRQRSLSIDLYELGSGLRSGATLAAGLTSASDLVAVAFADWDMEDAIYGGTVSPRQAFEASGFELCNIADRGDLEGVLLETYLAADPAINELIIATNDPTVLSLLDHLHLPPGARVRVWGEVGAASTTAPNVVFQPLETILGIKGQLVALYIDFENIAISLDKQGYTVNLEHLIARFVSQARAHGQVVKMAAYAPWGQRGSLPPVFNLPGKNSADMRIARDVMADLMHAENADIFIMASGDRDFNEVINALRTHNKQVIVWGVRGSISRQVETNPAVLIEYIEDFTSMQPHEALGRLYGTTAPEPAPAIAAPPVDVRPSQWVSAILQYDSMENADQGISQHALEDQLLAVNAVVSRDRAAHLVTQALAMDIFRASPDGQTLFLNDQHPLVEQTRLVRDRIVARVANTLDVRGWEYVNYGFLLKGIAMDRELDRPGLNLNDQWRSEWVDCLVREGILHRELIPHRHNPDDLVPVIKLSARTTRRLEQVDQMGEGTAFLYSRVDDEQLTGMEKRIVVSIEQFTSFRGFLWCPLGSLHRRLRPHDPGMVFQQAIEKLLAEKAVEVKEYENPQSEFKTKGISLIAESAIVRRIISERDRFVRALLALYDRHEAISEVTVGAETGMETDELRLWLSIMQDENVLNPVPGRSGQYSLFRTHHTVQSVASRSQ